MSQQGRRKSLFPGSTSIPSNTTFDFVSNGVNYKITLADLQAGLSVTGSIAQDGDALGTPILDVQGGANLVRNLETDSNSGLAFSVSAQNGVYAKLDAQSTGTGVPVLTAANKIRKIKAGSGVAVAASNGDIVISTTVVPGATRVVVVNDLADFPAPVTGVIPLAADTVYFINDIVDVGANTFTLASQTVLAGLSSEATGITSTATGNLFSNTGGFENEFSNLFIDAPTCTIFYLSHAGTDAQLYVHDVDIGRCVTACDITNCFLARFEHSGVELASADVFKFAGSCGLVNLATVLLRGFTGTVFALGSATFQRFNAAIVQITSGAGANKIIEGAASSGNIVAGGSGGVSGVSVVGAFTASVNILASDLRWDFTNNTFINDSVTDALLSMQANATNTVITVAGTAVKVAGAWVVQSASKMTGTAGGRVTYNAQRNVRVPIIASLSVTPVAGPTQTIAVYVAVNGSIVAASKRTAAVASGTVASITVPWRATLGTADYIEIFVANATLTNDLLVSSATLDVG